MLPKDFYLMFSCRTGSHLYGTSVSTSDVDTRGVFMPSKEYFLGFDKVTEQFENKESDTVFYELRKFLKLSLNANPSMLELLFVPIHIIEKGCRVGLTEYTFHTTPEWETIVFHRNKFLSKKVRHTFLGYAHSQFNRMLNSGGKGVNVTRKELIEKFGYDTKFASHVVRLLKEGEELLLTGNITLPRPEASLLREIRGGKYTLDEMRELVGDMEAKFDEFESKSNLPYSPDRVFVDNLCVDLVENQFFPLDR